MESIRYGRKRSGIKKELIKKVNSWLDSIDDDDTRKAAEKDVIVTGGSICSMLLGESVNDFDLYFRTLSTTKMVAEYYVQKFNKKNEIKVGEFVSPYTPYVEVGDKKNIKGETETRVMIYCKSAGVAGEDQEKYEYFEAQPEFMTDEFVDSLESTKDGEKYRCIFMSENAITLSDKVQIIIRFYGEPEAIHANYDFVHAMCYWDHINNKLELPAKALECMLSRTLLYSGSLYPVASIFRMKKFIQRGWRITAGQQLKIMWQISEIDLTDPAIMREQLTGVDQAYMHQLIDALNDVDPEKINSAYVGAIIDKIFE